MNTINFVKEHWKKLLLVAVYLVSVGGAYYYGHKSGPERIQIVDKIVEVRKETQQIVQHVNIDEIIKKIQETTKSTNTIVKREVIIKPDGTHIEREVKDSHTDQTTKITTNSETKVSEFSELKLMIQSLKQQEHTIVVDNTKHTSWRVGLQFGYGKSDINYIPTLPKHEMIGLFIEKQLQVPIIGNVGVGTFGTSRADVGVQLSKEF